MKRKISAPVKVGILILFLAIVAVLGAAIYRGARDFFLKFDMAQLPGVAIQNTLTPGIVGEGTPAVTPNPTQIAGPPPNPGMAAAG